MAEQYPGAPDQTPQQVTAPFVQQAAVPGDPQIPQSIMPGAHHVHHTYIWLAGLQTSFFIVFAICITLVGSVMSEVMEGSGNPFSDLGLFAFVLGAAALVLILMTVAVVMLVQWLQWRYLTYEITPTEFNLYSGIFSKKRVHVPYQRVQAVNQQAGILQRVAGVCSLKIDTAGGSSNNGVSVPYVKASDAEALRAELFRRKKVLLAGGMLDEQGNAVMPDGSVSYGPAAYASGAALHPASGTVPADGSGNILDAPNEIWTELRGVFAGAEQDTGAVSYETGLTNKELLLAGISGSAGSVMLVVAGAIALVAGGFQLFGAELADVLAAALGVSEITGATLMPLLSAFAWQIVMGGVMFVLAMWGAAVVVTLVTYGGFRARRRENRIEIEHGLLQHVFHGVDIDRVQSVKIKQGLIRRAMGYCELSLGKIDSAVSQEDSTQQVMSTLGVVIHPFVKTTRVPEILAGLAPEFADIPMQEVRPAPCAKRRAIVRMAMIRSWAFWGIFVAAALQLGSMAVLSVEGFDADICAAAAFALAYLPLYYVFAALMFAINTVKALLWFKGSSFACNDRFMRVTNSGYSLVSVVFPRRKIQFGYTKANPFQRRSGVCIVAAKTAAGIGGTVESIWDIPQEQADAWLEWVRPRR